MLVVEGKGGNWVFLTHSTSSHRCALSILYFWIRSLFSVWEHLLDLIFFHVLMLAYMVYYLPSNVIFFVPLTLFNTAMYSVTLFFYCGPNTCNLKFTVLTISKCAVQQCQLCARCCTAELQNFPSYKRETPPPLKTHLLSPPSPAPGSHRLLAVAMCLTSSSTW